jgi:GAF domain-containing protein
LGDVGLQRVMRGECHIDLAGHSRSGATRTQAFVPILAADQTVAVLAILRLLPQKNGFDGSDMKLFKLLSDEAAQPLFGVSFHSKPVLKRRGMKA